jgi:hypothetical protein
MKITALVLVALGAVAHAAPITTTAVPTVAPSGTAPDIQIKSPADQVIIATKTVATSGRHMESDSVVEHPADGVITLDVKNWKVAPHGNGIVLVIDNERAIEIHDLKKAITVEDVMGERLAPGWHVLAVFPTDADGRSVRGVVSVARFGYGSKAKPAQIEPYLKNAMVVVNRALLGTVSSGQNGPGLLLRTPTKPVLDVVVWFPPGTARTDCTVTLGGSELAVGPDGTKSAHVAAPGTYTLGAPERTGETLSVAALSCPDFKEVPMIPAWGAAAIRYYLK